MIDPVNIINYNYSDRELEELIVFCICVAGKTAKTIAPKVHAFCGYHPTMTPFQVMQADVDKHNVFSQMYKQKLGKYSILDVAFTDLLTNFTWKGTPHAKKGVTLFDLRTCTVSELETVHGVGPKTSRFFIMSTRPNVQHAALDTHVLKFLRSKGIDAPKSTPSSKKQYAKLEAEFLKLAKQAKMSPAEFDLKIWNMYARK